MLKNNKNFEKNNNKNSSNQKKKRVFIINAKERRRRRRQMKNINLFYRTIRICKYCNKKFSARLRRTYCNDCIITNKLMKAYNITELEYNKMLKKNNGLCELCLKRPATVVDHDHTTGKVRGLLCRFCNTSLRFFDNKELFKKMYTYSNKFRKK